jgi:hypothetical protein
MRQQSRRHVVCHFGGIELFAVHEVLEALLMLDATWFKAETFKRWLSCSVFRHCKPFFLCEMAAGM